MTAHEVDQVDVVVVGAWSSGCVVASRLSQDPDLLVALLENGPDRDPSVAVPGYAAGLPGTWRHRSTGRPPKTPA